MTIDKNPIDLREEMKNQSVLERFPFPFKGDSYRYSNNAEALSPSFLLDITPEYFEEINLKRQILDTKKDQAYQSFSHSLHAQWEILEMIMNQLTTLYPINFS